MRQSSSGSQYRLIDNTFGNPETIGVKVTLYDKINVEKTLKNPKDLKITFEVQNNELLVV